MLSVYYRCIICLKDLYIPGFSPWWEIFYFWIGKGKLYLHIIDGGDYTEEHHLCLCQKDFKYVNDNKAIGEVLINTRLCQK